MQAHRRRMQSSSVVLWDTLMNRFVISVSLNAAEAISFPSPFINMLHNSGWILD